MKTKNKEKETTKPKKTSIVDIFFVLITVISSAFLIYTLTLLGPIETTIRYIVIGIIALIDLILIINLFRKKKKKKQLKKSIKRFFLVLLIILYIFLGYTLYRITGSIDNMNKEFVTTSTSLVALKENKITDINKIKNAKIAISNGEEDQTSYDLQLELIDEYNLDDNNELLSYEDNASMIRDLYSKEVDYIFLPTNYGAIYSNYEEYETLEDDTKILISKEKKETKEELELLGTSKDISEPFTILLLGVDSKSEGIENADSFNGDAMILVTFNPDTLTATMLSIPRDTYVPIACFSNKAENKITHAASRGTKCVINTIQNFTGITIDYYAKINFAGLVDLVDALGGIEVDVPYAFCEQNSKRKWGKNTVYVEKGLQTLDGEQALALSRNRKNNAKGMKACGTKYSYGTRNDFVRGQNQQLVIKGIVNKAKNLENVTKVVEILDAISNNMDTNMERDTILSFYNIAKDIMTTANNKDGELVTIQKLYLAGSDQRIYDERSNLVLYNYIPNQDSKAKVIKAMKQNLGLIEKEIDKDFSYSVEDEYTQNVIGKSGNKATTLYPLIPDFTTYTKAKADSWALKNGFTIVYNEVEDINPGIITAQSYPAKKRVDLCTSKTITLTITIAKEKEPIVPENKPETDNNTNTENNNENNNNNNNKNSNNENTGTETPTPETPPTPENNTNE
ncbi:MAG: LCP family protein [Bacilli bacterium]|nr:LCP family protein [Bacilli bacterium]